MKALCIFLGLILIGAVIAGVLLGNSELLNPSLHKAEADRLRAETDAIRAKAAYEQRQRELELRAAEQKAMVELQALRDRRAVELALLETAGIVAQVVGSMVVIMLAGAVSYYLVAKARALTKEHEAEKMHYSEQKAPPLTLQRAEVSAFHISYKGFLNFCDDFILSNGHRTLSLDCTRPDSKRKYYPTGISPDVARIYFSVLCRARIVTLKTNGRSEWILRQGINTIDDIRLRIPREKFDEISNLYLRLGQIESMTSPETEPEHN